MKATCVLLLALAALAAAQTQWYIYGSEHDTVEVPDSWTCPDSWWAEARNASSPSVDCDCGCGAVDPDCDFMVDSYSTVLANGFVSEFQMEGGSLFCDPSDEEGTNTDFAFCHKASGECEPLPPHPWATHCPPDWYNEVGFGNDTPDCDCNCLIYDIDCNWKDEIVSTFCTDFELEGSDPDMYVCTGDAKCVSPMDCEESSDSAENIINFNFAGMIPK